MVSESKYTMEELAEKLGISTKTLSRYKAGSRQMPINLYWKLVLITRFTDIIPILGSDLDRYWHVKKKKKPKDAKEDNDEQEDNDDEH